MARKRVKHRSCSVFGCTNEHNSQFLVPSSEPLKNQWVNFIFSGNDARVCAKHFTDDCFLNLGQYRAGLAQRLNIKSGSVPTLLGSATNLGQATTSSAYIQQPLSRDVACQTDHLETRTVGTQLSLKTLRPHFKSEGHGSWSDSWAFSPICFHGPRVESSFSLMNEILDPRSGNMKISTFGAIQTVKYTLQSREKTAVELSKREEALTNSKDGRIC